MKTILHKNYLEVDRECIKYPTESAWWYALKKELNRQGHDLVKKVMSKDGHMMGSDTYPYYLRDRHDRYCFYDGEYAIRLVNQPERVTLCISGDASL